MNLLRSIWNLFSMAPRIPAAPPVPQAPSVAALPPEPPAALQALSAFVGERLGLAQEIADEAAQSEIECNCAAERLGTRDWYDTSRNDAGGDPIYAEGLERALRYLELRRRVVRHPVQRHLVRFER